MTAWQTLTDACHERLHAEQPLVNTKETRQMKTLLRQLFDRALCSATEGYERYVQQHVAR